MVSKVDEKLEILVKKIIKTKKDTLKITDSKCLKKHYAEIIDIIEDRSIKTLVECLNENGFSITYKSMQSSLNRIGKKQQTSQNQENNILSHDKIITPDNKKVPNVVTGGKYMSLKEKAEAELLAEGLDLNANHNPLLKKRLELLAQREKDKEK
jgi:hypothetical protein